MTIDKGKLKRLRVALAGEAARLNGLFSLYGKVSDSLADHDARLSRAELDLINALLAILDLRLLLSKNMSLEENNADPVPPEVVVPPDVPEPQNAPEAPLTSINTEDANASKTPANSKALLGIEHESGLVVEFPSISAAANMLGVNLSNFAKFVSYTTAEEWRKGPKYLARLAYHTTHGWSFILKERLSDEEKKL